MNIAKIKFTATCLCLFSSLVQAATCLERWDQAAEGLTPKLAELRGLCDNDLKRPLQELLAKNHVGHHYNLAKQALSREIQFDDSSEGACSVYSPTHCEGQYALNVEHTWPQSQGAGVKPMISDIHHLFLTEAEFNSVRSNYPFCDVERAEWQAEGSRLGFAKDGNQLCFEPPDSHKGNVARAMFYFASRYSKKIGSGQENTFRRWHALDPVDAQEILRNDRIEEFQGNRNLFVDTPMLESFISDF